MNSKGREIYNSSRPYSKKDLVIDKTEQVKVNLFTQNFNLPQMGEGYTPRLEDVVIYW